MPQLHRARRIRTTRWGRCARIGAAALGITACGPRVRVPTLPDPVPRWLAAGEREATLTRTLAPVLYLQRDETFPLTRVGAVVDTAHRVIAYHLLWRDDVHGAWLPSTRPTDEEIVWVGYAPDGRPTDVWTYWHGVILHQPWTTLPVEINVQWGKHGSIPRGFPDSRLPGTRTMNFFYAMAFFGLPDIWLGRLNRPGPWGFFHGYRRYREFTRPLPIGDRISAVIRAGPYEEGGLRLLFGYNYARKRAWPWR